MNSYDAYGGAEPEHAMSPDHGANPMTVRVVVVDDQELVRAGLARILGPGDGFEVVGQCIDGREVSATVAATRPDVVLMDLRMPHRDGLQAMADLAALDRPPPVLVVTTFDDDHVLWAALEAGAAGFLLKDAGATAIIAATRAVAAGGAWFDPAVAPRVLAAYRSRVAPRERRGLRLRLLSDRELQVVGHVCRGRSNAEIAGVLHLSEATVKSHLSRIFTKLDLRDRAMLIVYAYDQGLATIEPS